MPQRRAVSAVVPILVSHGDAFVAHDSTSDRWSIGSRDLDVSVGFDPAGAFTLQSITNPVTGRSWNVTPAPDVSLTAGSKREVLGKRTSGLTFINAQAEETRDGVRLTFTFEDRSAGVLIARVYASYPGSPTVEAWTRIQAISPGATATLADLVAWQITMPVSTVHTLTGLRGLTEDHEEAFTRESRDLDPGERLDFGADARSTQEFVPLVSVDDGRDEFFGGLVWSGAWNMSVERLNDRLRVTASFQGLSPTVSFDRPVDLPHGFFGVTSRAATTVSGALRQFVSGLRHGRPFQPLVTYNTWFAYGTTINEGILNDEIDRAAALGVELFVVDAGWYVGAGATSDSDFESGLGSWATDPDRFPSGLAGLADRAHALGMKFGLWVEPERVALDTVDLPSLARETWLVTANGQYGSPTTALVCLSDAGARQWVWAQLVALIEDTHLDYLKWDNNFWLNCNRGGHGHGATDGSFAHVQALYRLYADLHERYPDLMLENVASGGNRLDFGMLRYTDVAWMDDKTDPSVHVRHNLEGLTFAYSPAYLSSFVLDGEIEPLFEADLRFILRSRMPGVFGLTLRTSALGEGQLAILKDEIDKYKALRDIVAQSNAILLGDQAPVSEDSWEVLEEIADDQASALVFVFKGNADEGRLLVRPRGLRNDVDYDVRSLDTGPLGSASGDTLMADGFEVVHTAESPSRAHIFVFQAR